MQKYSRWEVIIKESWKVTRTNEWKSRLIDSQEVVVCMHDLLIIIRAWLVRLTKLWVLHLPSVCHLCHHYLTKYPSINSLRWMSWFKMKMVKMMKLGNIRHRLIPFDKRLQYSGKTTKASSKKPWNSGTRLSSWRTVCRPTRRLITTSILVNCIVNFNTWSLNVTCLHAYPPDRLIT